ncbi:MAG: oxidative damage protection protein [Gammaproteobacteria bacterium]|nr:oxidative damage protection protein [Gammaproteobacteria bacterium]MDH5660338.1 oxidative damage protection protein [Gammaproteobacteria bacterium]
MSRMVNCVVLKKEAEGLDKPPYPGELGQRIYENASKEAWQMWMKQQTMLMNENRLSPIDPKHRQFLVEEMEKFFFGEGSVKVEGYTPE